MPLAPHHDTWTSRISENIRRLFCLLILGLLLGCTRQTTNLHSITLLSPADQRIELRVEIADDPEERSRGLMFREELSEGRGMLFIFEEPQILGFWMKNTLIPLDILFFDVGGKLVSTTTMEPCEKDPCRTYPSAAEAQYAIEVRAGVVKRNDIGEGWRLPLPRGEGKW